MTDYRDRLEELFRSLKEREGLSHYRISKRAGLSEQRISNLLKKRTNLSVPSLESMLTNLGYQLRFEETETVSTGDSQLTDRRLIERNEMLRR
jgi:transcriptional regulator with XRE-family HTH domain